MEQHRSQLLGIEARLRSIAREDGMPADDIVAKTIPAMGVVAIAGRAPGFGPANVVPVVNRLEAQFDQLAIYERVKEAGPRVIFYEHEHGEDVTVFLGLPVARPPQELPAPAHYRVLPEILAAVAVRSGPSASIYPMVYQDLVRWIEERGYRPVPGPGRDVWVHRGNGQGIPSSSHFLARFGGVCPTQNQYMFSGADGRRRLRPLALLLKRPLRLSSPSGATGKVVSVALAYRLRNFRRNAPGRGAVGTTRTERAPGPGAKAVSGRGPARAGHAPDRFLA
jgi:hypothetical protein